MPSLHAKRDKEKEKLLDKEPSLSSKAGGYGSTKDSKETSKSKKGDENGKKAEKKPTKSRPLKDLFRYASCGDIALVLLGVLFSIFNGAAWPLMSIIFGGLTNTFIAAQNSYTLDESVWGNESTIATVSNATTIPPDLLISADQFKSDVIQYSLYYTYLALAIMVASYVQVACWMASCERQIHKIRQQFFYAILRQEISWFDKHQSGELTSTLSDNLERIKEGIGDKFGLLIQYFAQFVAGFVVAFIYSWKLTLVMMSLTPLLAFAGAFMSKMIASSTRKEQESYAVAGAIAEEVFSCVRTVIAFNGQKQECERYREALENGKKLGIMKSFFTGLGLFFTFLIMFSSYALAFWYGSTLILSNEIARGTVFVVFFSVMTGSFSLGNAAPQISVIATATGAASFIYEIIDAKPTIDPYSRGGKRLEEPQGKIEFGKVRFSYPTRKDVTVMSEVSFAVEPGETVALVGPSGCGKSTVVNLLLRYYDPDQGQILIDGEDIRQFNIHWLRNLIGVVNQEPILFDASVEENIYFGRKNITNAEMIKAAKMANAHDFISDLPQGYNTMVGERGTQLSGGQKQRIAIARTLVRDPKILLLDEATSALDAESEGIVQEALDKARSGRTTIIIAHRLSTIRNADKIIAVENGKIVECGSHVELMNKKGLYYQLVTAQTFDNAASGYASETDRAGTAKDESDDSGTSADIATSRKRSARKASRRRMSTASGVSDSSSVTPKRRLSRMLSKKIDSEQERLKKEVEEENVQRSTLWQIMKENRQEWFYIFMGFLGAILRGAVMPAFAFFYSEIFNVFSKQGEELRSGATFWSLMFLVIGLAQGVGMIVSTFFFGCSGEMLTMRLRLKVFTNILRQDVGYFDDPKHSTGKLCTRLATDAPNVKGAVDFRLATVLSSAISMIAGIVIALIYGWKLALLILALVPLLAIAGSLNMRLRTGNQQRDASLLEEAGKTAAEAIENIRTVQALTRERTFFDTFCQHLLLPYKQGLRQVQIQAVSYGLAQSIFFFLYAAAFRFGGYLVEIGDIPPLNVFRVFFAITFCGMTIGWATAYFPEYIKARFSGALIFKMINEKPKIDSYSVLGVTPDLSGRVTFSDVHFAYPTRPDVGVLQGLGIRVDPGNTLALVGSSGCGKSTVVNLIERFYDPHHGQIMVDEFDIRTVNLMYLRQHMAVVSQEPVLFDCSIKENIVYGLSEVPYEKVVEAATLANIHEFILSLPDGYNTRVGEKGTQLSGGQKQRVAIARALVRDPKILLLDEATSALDTESEKVVQEALDKARLGRTCIVIAHRLSTVQNADRIAVIKEGKVVEEGNHSELVGKRGFYYLLTKKQNIHL